MLIFVIYVYCLINKFTFGLFHFFTYITQIINTYKDIDTIMDIDARMIYVMISVSMTYVSHDIDKLERYDLEIMLRLEILLCITLKNTNIVYTS